MHALAELYVPELPRLPDRYRMEREIGSGGMATVYLAKDLKPPQRLVAVKILRRDIATLMGSERFLREIEIAAQLTHPHILPLLDSGEVDDLPFYVMPFVEGESLRDRIAREKQLPVDVALRLAEEVADGLSYAHSHAIVHRDIKPGNILIEGDQAWIADFGIARALTVVAGDRLTSAGVTVGTPEYMSPEQTFGGEVDGRSDLYSLGCVLHEMLAGGPPFTGPTAQAIAARHRTDQPLPIRSVRPAVSLEVEQVVRRTLEKLPADRFETGAQLAEAIRAVEPRSLASLPSRIVEPPRPALLRWWRRVALGAVAILVVLGVWQVWKATVGPHLDPLAVVVFPFAVRGGAAADGSVGEDVADVLHWRLAETNLLHATFAWHALEDRWRDDPSLLPPQQARHIAEQEGAGRYVVGTVLLGSPVRVLLELHDVAADSIDRLEVDLAQVDDRNIMGVRAANEILRVVLPDQSFRPSAFSGRSTVAVESFLLGQGAYRRAEFETALARFQEALAADSEFALAAVRGAQAAGWVHHPVDPSIRRGLSNAGELPEPYASFARGVEAYLASHADTAVYWLERVLENWPRWPESWMALGEVYMHLLPDDAFPDSLAQHAFERVHEFYPSFAPVLYHLLPFAVRDRDGRKARALLEPFRAVSTDTTLVRVMTLMSRCTDAGDARPDWVAAARSSPAAVNDAAQWLTTGGLAAPDCALAAWRALLVADPTPRAEFGSRYEWGAFLGAQYVLAARGDTAGVRALFDADSVFGRHGYHEDLYLLHATAGLEVDQRAQRAGEQRYREFRDGRNLSSHKLWFLGTWLARQGEVAEVTEIADSLLRRAAGDTTPGEGRLERLLGRSLEVRAALARGDTSDALWQLRGLAPTARGAALRWDPFESLGGERVLLAQVLLAVGDADGAMRVASLLDSPVPLIYPIYLRESLEIRMRAAEALGRPELTTGFRDRLSVLMRAQGNGSM